MKFSRRFDAQQWDGCIRAFTIWQCDACHAAGAVEHDEHAGGYEVVTLIREDHASKSEQCAFTLGASAVRVEIADPAVDPVGENG